MVNVEMTDSWEKVNLGNALSYIGNGLTDKQNKVNDGYPVTRIETISDDCIDTDKVGYISALPDNKIEKYRLCYGDMLVSHINSNPQLGRSVIYEGYPEFLLHGMNLLRMRANTKVLTPFFLNLIFRFYRNRGVFIALASRAVGQSSINQSRMKSLIIPLPPLPEQRAIAHVLGTIQEAQAARQRELELERERKAALMDHLFSYGTKGEPRKQTEIGEIPESWEVVRLETVLNNTQYGLSAKANLKRQGYPLLRMNNLVDGLVDISDLKHIQLDKEELEKFRLNKGDVLFNRTNSFELVGKTGLFDKEGDYVFASYLIRLVTAAQCLNSYFLSFYFNWVPIQVELKRLSFRGAGQSNISASKLKMFKIRLPSFFEQQQIAEVLCAFDKKIAALEQEAARLDELFHAMLDELMTGQRSAVPLIDAESVQSASSV